MPPKPKPLPEGFEESATDKKQIRCLPCAAFQPVQQKQWMLRGSLSKHLNTEDHKRCVRDYNEKMAKMREAEHTRAAINQQFLSLGSTSMPEKPDAAARTAEWKMAMVEETRTMWERYEMEGANFSAGVNPLLELNESRARLENQCDNFAFADLNEEIQAGRASGDFEDTEPEQDDQLLSQLLDNYDDTTFPDDNTAEHVETVVAEEPRIALVDNNSGWAPYASKAECLLDIIDNLPRMPISDALMKVILWLLNENGVKNVPSFYRLRKVQKELRSKQGVQTVQQQSMRGNIFFINDPRALVAQDWSNPSIRSYIHVYPEISDSHFSEIWHADKWRRDIDLDILSPMYDAGERHYYVNETTLLRDGRLIIPFRWVIYQNAIHAESRIIQLDDYGCATIDPNTPAAMIAASDMVKNYFDLKANGELPKWDETCCHRGAAMPNPLRKIAKGRPLYTSFVDYFGDDVSGNRSKSWNKHLNAYMAHRNLPRALLQQEYHTHFLSTSQHASVAEQFTGFKKIIEQTHDEPVEARDGLTGENICFRMFVSADPSDNPMQSEVSSHIGGTGNLLCRKCDAGGTAQEKESTDGFEKLFKPGKSRSRDTIIESLQQQLRAACSGISLHVKKIQTETGVKDVYTQYWINQCLDRAKEMQEQDKSRAHADIEAELMRWVQGLGSKIYSGFLTLKGFDPTIDTPVEILHTILLGLVKYSWYATHSTWSTAHKDVFARRLQGTSIDGLSIAPICADYILQFANSLIGRQLKTLTQTTLFHVHDLVSPTLFQLWRATGELSALLWIPEIYELETYLNDVDTAVANVLDTFGELDATKLLHKPKLHLQVHITADIRRFGPLVGVSTEGYESFNAVFRNCSVFSNHRAPSRDIALQLAEQENMKHRITGGWYPAKSGNGWERAGAEVRKVIARQPILQRLIGWSLPENPIIGSSKLQPIKKDASPHPVLLSETNLAKSINAMAYIRTAEETAKRGHSFIAQSSDECMKSSWVFARSPLDDSIIIGRVEEILIVQPQALCVAVIDMFCIAAARHNIFGMPWLQRPQGDLIQITVPAKDVLFKFNAQHDCLHAKCQATGQRARIQERQQTELMETFIEHIHHPIHDRFIVNMHAFHNAHLIRKFIPRTLSAPQLLYPDRVTKHAELSQELRKAQLVKRKEQKEKRAATAAKKAAAASSAATDPQRADVVGDNDSGAEGDRATRRKRRRVDEAPRQTAE